ncbi:hypothetical protein BDW22DRAFT_1344362 [Trametopsis cervina]|nr:hypothetical protein BDW22DRAFT_1344362 [Trametopsis cervina]
MSVIAIITTIITAAELAQKAAEVARKLIPSPPTQLKEKHRWMQCTIKNETQFSIFLENTYFDSGRYWDAPGSIKPFDQGVFSICNGDGTILTGASGGNAFKLDLDNQHDYYFSLGWTAPQFGAYKTSVVESKDPKVAYEAAKDTGGSINSSTTYKGTDKDGKAVKFTFHISSAPSQNSLFVINQDLSAA